jgi:hypothetical protein
MPRLTDIWRVGIVGAPLSEIAVAGLGNHKIGWISTTRPFTFLADPFGLWRDDILHLFVEAYDYRERRGRIDLLRFDRSFAMIDRQTCLSERWHLSYPFVFEAEGETWMLPEAHRSGGLHLYRATEFPLRWERHSTIALDGIAVDATPVFHDGLWWLFYTVATSKRSKIGALHVAFAEKLAGPWRCHPRNPVRFDVGSSRPGGSPVAIGGILAAPMQDCTRTYGGGIQMLWMDRLTPDDFHAQPGQTIMPRHDFAPFADGLHSLSACGGITLIDAKRIDRSWRGLAIDIGRTARGVRRS